MLVSDNAAQAALTRELLASEHLLWSGMPRQGVRFRPGDIFMIPFSLLWGGVAFFWEYNVAFNTKAPPFFLIFGGFFVLVGIYIIVGRFYVDSYRRSRTYYGVTDQRALILGGIFAHEIRALSLSNLDEISLTERSDGSGDIVLGAMNPMYAMWRDIAWPGMERKLAPTFEFVDDVRQVYSLIQQVQQKK